MTDSGREAAFAATERETSTSPRLGFDSSGHSLSRAKDNSPAAFESTKTDNSLEQTAVDVQRNSESESDRFLPFETSKVIIALPAYNEAESLVPLLDRIDRAMKNFGRDFHVIVVNDGSKDDTALVASQYTFRMDLTLVNHEVNKGFGAAVESGILKAIEIAGEHDVVVTMDADNTQPPESIHRMVALIEDGYDVVIASRYRTGARVVGVPVMRNVYSLGARAIFTCLFPTRGVRDYTCGFRAFRASVLKDAHDTYGDKFFSEDGFSTTVDLLLKVRKLPSKTLFYEVPLILRYDQKEGVSKMNVARTIKQTLGLIARRKLKLGK